MGNCLFLEKKPVRIMKSDGKILEYKSPTRVFQVLSDFAGHAISDTVPVSHHLQQNTKLLRGHLYFLIPTPAGSPPSEFERKPKKVRFSIPAAEEKETDDDDDDEGDDGKGRSSSNVESSEGHVVRIKLVLTKKELQEMIENGGISAEEVVCRLKSEVIRCRDDFARDNGGDELQRWKPALESIPESEADC